MKQTSRKLINLLPPEEQRRVKVEALNAEVRNFGIWIILSLGGLIVCLFAAQIYLKEELKNSTDELAVQNNTLQNLETNTLRKEVGAVNQDLENFKLLESTHENWSLILKEFASLLPPSVILDSFTVNRADRKVEAKGHAGNRDAVLELRGNLVASKLFTNVNFPLANLEKPRDLPWKYNFFVRPEGLK